MWPLFHYLLWLDSTATVPSPDPLWTAYYKANTLFSAKVAEVYRPGDLIIVHDYHLLLAPKMIREALGQMPQHTQTGWDTVTPSPALQNETRKGMDWENQKPTSVVAEAKSRLDKLDGMLGTAGASISDRVFGYKDHKDQAEIMIGMFMHTPWPSSEIFRCLPSESSTTCYDR